MVKDLWLGEIRKRLGGKEVKQNTFGNSRKVD